MSGRTVLVVDDNDMNLELVTEILQGAGYAVVQAKTAEEGLVAARSKAPHLILLDIGLPGLDGHAAVRVLKADPFTQRIPTVALTAYAMTGDEEEAYRSGFDAYIAKPFRAKALEEMVARWIGEGGAAS